ncbi:uncharacterized protein LOC126273083 [Schistocerca gregaria]|uniref:uncharacterized protein LOC126273083 n=1 Tax=Schistocerca gregaria TaxID=7010 RepID=UPI00211E5655|nr:uncharacterized protein LOC126273083 [Schistocerca gregaria]
MRVLAVAVLLFAATVSARPEAPSNQYGAPSGASSAPAASASGPYPPSGWRPAGRQFVLPSRQSAAVYPPPQQYGPPPTTTEAAEATTTEQPTTTASVPAVVPAGSRSAAQREPLESNDAGVYYVLLPDGRLQRVSYAHGPAPAMFSLLPERLTQGGAAAGAAVADAGYLARIHYQNLLPVGAPVYTYATPELVRVF